MSTLSSRTGNSAGQRGRLMRACCEQLETRRLLAVVTTGDQFGLVDGRNVTLQLPDGDGDIVQYSLTGGATGQIVDNSLVLTGTTDRSTLRITVRKRAGGDGLVTLSGITADGFMQAITASPAIVDGNLTLNTTPTSETTRTVAITLSQMQNGSINTGGEPISSLRLQEWAASDTATQQVVAPWIGILSVSGRRGAAGAGLRGDFAPTVVLDGRDSRVVALRTATIVGTMGSIDAPSGGIASLTAGEINGTVSGLFIGTLRTRVSRGEGAPDGSVSGEIRAVGSPPQAGRDSIATVQIAGSTDGLTIRADEGNLGNITIAGDAASTRIFSAGNARTLRIGQAFSNSRIQTQGNVTAINLGSMADSNVLVGFAPEFAGDFPGSNADFAAGADTAARLGSFTAGRSQRGTVVPQITGTNNLSAAQLGNVSIFNLESMSPPSLKIYVLTDPTGKSPASVRYTDSADRTNSFNWRRGQTQPQLLVDMLTIL